MIAGAVFGLIALGLFLFDELVVRRGAAAPPGPLALPAAAAPAVLASAAEVRDSGGAGAGPVRPRCDSGIFLRALPAAAGPGEPSAPPAAALFGLDRPGVYTTAELGGPGMRQGLSGQRAAERVISGGPQRAPRRGRKAALDAIVVGATRDGIAATLRLRRAGLRVLLVDADGEPGSEPGPPLPAPSSGPQRSSCAQAALLHRLPLVRGHRVLGVSERADGMLELSAERATWYTANVIVALPCGARDPDASAA